MPTYEYECRKCGHTFEKFQSMTAERIRTCPQCKGRVDRLIGTGAGIIFKGSGFYQTDYRSDSYQTHASKDSTSSSSSSASSSPAKKESSDKTASSGTDSGSTSKKDKKTSAA